jgi:hypothetical protein
MEIWNSNVECGGFSKYLTIWSKVTLGYASKIWKENVNRFPDYDWILYNNKRLKDVDLSEDITQYKDYGIIYLKIAIKESGRTYRQCPCWPNVKDDEVLVERIFKRWEEYVKIGVGSQSPAYNGGCCAVWRLRNSESP